MSKYPVTDEGRPIFGEGSDWCVKSYLAGVASEPKYTREELVEIAKRAAYGGSFVESRALYVAINALEEAGALTVKE
jgi:hypothetical protein